MNLTAPRNCTGAEVLVWPAPDTLGRVQALNPLGEWRSLDGALRNKIVPVDLRGDATAYIRQSGYRYILIDTAKGPFTEIGRDMLEHPSAWCVLPAARNGDVWLFYIN